MNLRIFLRFALLISAFTLESAAFAQLSGREIRDRKSGRFTDDTSHVYTLPYSAGASFLLVQGSNTKMSHRNMLAHDFKMKEGTEVCAARSGEVIGLRGDSRVGGLKQEHLSEGNYIIIRHDDGSRAYYWHFRHQGVVVEVGERVQQGQLIGYSGNTGYSAFPHLHFQVSDAEGRQILVRFRTGRGDRYLRPGKWYRRP